MTSYRSQDRLAAHAHLWLGSLLLLLGLGACGIPEQHTGNTVPTTPPPLPTITPLSVQLTQPTDPLSSDTQPMNTPQVMEATMTTTWQTYRSEQAGYTIEYPKDWTVDEQVGSNGTARSIVTTFRPSGGGPLIIVATQAQTPDQAEPLDIPNTRCQQVPGNRGIATRCFDTISRTTATTIIAQGKTYTVTSAGKDINQIIYQHALDSFTPFATAVTLGTAELELLLFRSGDLPTGVTASHAGYAVPLNFTDDPPAAAIVGQDFAHEGRGAGGVSLLLYTSATDLASAYVRLTTSVLSEEAASGNKPQPIPGVGEQARAARLTLASSTYGKNNVSVIIFTRCHAVVDIRLNEWAGMTREIAATYATALDTRITPKVCQ